MLDDLQASLAETVRANAWLAPLAALAGGLLTAANPCVLASVPLMMAYAAGQQAGRSVARSFLLSLVFVLGLTITFSLLLLTTWAAGSILGARGWTYVAAAVCLLMGLHLLGVLKLHIPAPAGATPVRRGYVGALLLGMLFGLISMPCAGPILVVLLSIVPLKGLAFGLLLLAAYSLGHGALILAGGTSVGLAQKLIASHGLQRSHAWAQRIAGGLALAVGAYLLWAA